MDLKKLAQLDKGRDKPKGATTQGQRASSLVRNELEMKCLTSHLRTTANRWQTPKKGSMLLLDDKKKGPTAQAPAKSKVTSSYVATRGMPTFAVPR